MEAQRFAPGLAIASYIVGDEKSGEAAVIDPTRDVGNFISYAKDNDLHIKHIIETHVHADFVCGSRELKARLNDEPSIHCSGYGGDDWTQPYAANGCHTQVEAGAAEDLGDLDFSHRRDSQGTFLSATPGSHSGNGPRRDGQRTRSSHGPVSRSAKAGLIYVNDFSDGI